MHASVVGTIYTWKLIMGTHRTQPSLDVNTVTQAS